MAFGGSHNPIKTSEDLRRVLDLPGRGPLPPLPAVADNPLCKLKPVQEQALREFIACKGGAGPIAVGGGKTLISLLLPPLLGNPRSVLLLPGGLIEKTEVERIRYRRQGWNVSMSMRMIGYEALGRKAMHGELEFIGPELIIGDEIHKLKHRKSAVTRRVDRYMDAHPETIFVGLGGTFIEKELELFAHILIWALKERAPVPFARDILREWGEALNPNVDDFKRRAPGALLELSPGAEDGPTAFRDKLRDTPGIVFSTNDQDCKSSIILRRITYEHAKVTDDNFKTLRMLNETPDGWALTEAMEVSACARQLALGLHYIWAPRPPDPWYAARKAWGKFVRDVLSRSSTVDSESQVVSAVDAGEIDDLGLLAAWRKEAPTFEINVQAVWHDDAALKVAEAWIHKEDEPGIVWTQHSFFGRELARRTGLDYFGAGGMNSRKERIDDESRAGYGKPCIASVKANATGRNLQPWSRGLITCPLPDAGLWEQLIGRHHRTGQQADTIQIDVFYTCKEHMDAFDRALDVAASNFALNGQTSKLLIADILPPPKKHRGNAWSA